MSKNIWQKWFDGVRYKGLRLEPGDIEELLPPELRFTFMSTIKGILTPKKVLTVVSFRIAFNKEGV
jgi:hypothetical protein